MKQSILILMMMLWAGTSWGQTTVSYDFSVAGAVSGLNEASPGISLDSNIGFGSFKNSGTANPAIVSGQLRLYQNATKGGSIKIYASNGVTITDVVIRASGSGGTGPAAYSVDGVGSTPISISGGSYSITGISASSEVEFWCTGSSSSTRIYVDDFDVTYNVISPTVTIANTGTPAASDITQGTNDVVLFGFSLTPSASVDFTAVSIATTGTATTSDLSNFELVYDADSDGVYDVGESIVSDQLALANPLSFTMSGQTGIAAERRYLLIADVAAGATVGNTFTASIAAASDVTTTGDESGTAAGNQQTIISASAPIITVTGSLSSFGNVAKDSHSASQSYTVAGSNLNDNITITAPTGFAVSTDDVTFSSSVVLTASSGSVSSTTIYVRFSPSTDDGTKTGSITHVSTGATTQNQAVEGFAIASEPTTAASSLNFTSVTENSFTINWTRGNGNSVLVIMKSGSAVDFDPSDGTEYTANATFGSGTELGTGNYVVYNGTGTSVAVTGLTASTTYHVEVFEYNYGSATGTENYNVTSTLTGSEATDGPDYLETFANYPETGTSYNTGTFTGADGSTWNYVKSAGPSNAQITSPSPLLGKNQTPTAEVYSGTISGGISTLSFDYLQAFSTNVSLEVYVNNRLITTVTSSNQQGQTINSGSLDVYEVGDVVIKFSNPSGGQVAIDNIAWNSYSDGTRQITGTAGWRMLSAPIAGFTVADLSDDTAIQGITGGANESNDANFYYYGSSGAWTEPTNTSTAFGDGYGFITYFYHNSTAGSSPLPLTLDVTGTEPSSDVTVTLNKTTESNSNFYTLVGNPYASNFSLSSITNNGDGIGANIVIWDNSAGVAGDYQDMTVGSGIVAPWQGFWVSVPSAGTASSITLPTSGKTTSASTAAYFKTAASQEIEGQFIMQYTDKLSAPFKVRMLDGASVGNDINDLAKFTSLSSVYATVAGRLEAAVSLNAIEALPLELTEAVTLVVEPMIAGVSGAFTLNWKQFETFPEYLNVTLFDSETGLTYNLREAGSLSFTYTAKAAPMDAPLKNVTAESSGNERFKVVIEPISTSVENRDFVPSTLELSQNFPNPFNPSTTIQYAIPAQSNVRLAVYDMLGREVSVLVAGKTQAAGRYEVQFDASALSSGMYLYRLEAGSTVITKKLTLIK